VTAEQTKKAVFYSRVSTSDQVEGTSLDTQKAWCLAQISKMGMQFFAEYSDRGLSGADESRPGWQALLADARSGKFDAVFVYDLDRFTRDMFHGLQATRELRSLGVSLHDAKDPNSDAASDSSQLMTGFRLLIAEEERRKIKERTVRGQRAKLDAGLWPGGKPSFGWKLEGIGTRNPRPVPDHQERETLELLYNWLVRERKTTGEMCDLLNAAGIKSRTGLRWSHAVLRRILSNPALWRGWFIWGSPNQGSIDARSHKTKIDREGKPIYGTPKKILLPEPPLSESQFNAMQRVLASHPRAQNPQRPSVTRPLSGKIFGTCGMHYTGTSIAGKDYDVYRCTGNRHRGNERHKERCGCPQVNAQLLERRVWQEVVGLLADPEKLQDLAKEWLQISGSESDTSNTEFQRLEQQEAKLLRAIALVQDDYYLAEVAEQEQLQRRIEKYRSDLSEITKRKSLLDAYKADVNLQNRQLESLADLAERAQHRLASLNLAEQREVFELLGIKVMFSQVVESEPVSLTIFGHIDERIGQSTHIGPIPGESNLYPEVSFVLGSNA
jgi:DNA invertase Pin-like site-specific DNA recombinase